MAKKKAVGGKRADGEGSFTQRKNGLWMGQISLGRNVKGALVRKSVYGKTLKEVRDKAVILKKQQDTGLTNERVGTVAEFLDLWISEDVKVTRAGHKTIYEYEDACKRYIKPYIGHVPLQKLTSAICRQWQSQMDKDGFTPNTRRKAMRDFNIALNVAIRQDLIVKNPLFGVPKPSITRREIRPIEAAQCEILFQQCQKHRLGGVIILATMTGLRKAEIFALRWEDIDFTKRVLVLQRSPEEVQGRLPLKSPKTKAGRRAVALDAIAIEALVSRRKKALEEGITVETGQIIFSNRQGGHMRHSNFDRRVWYPIREKAQISETVRFHDLRHTQATLMLAAGVHPKIVQERLGHSDISLTMRV